MIKSASQNFENKHNFINKRFHFSQIIVKESLISLGDVVYLSEQLNKGKILGWIS